MKNVFKVIVIIALVATIVFSMAACTKSGGGGVVGGGKSLNSADDLKAYLDSQPANSKDKPIKVRMKLNEPMFPNVSKTINDASKYVSLDLSGSPTTTIPSNFQGCELLVGIIIPDNVTSIEESAFEGCTSLTSVTIGKSVTSIEESAFEGCTSLTSVTIPDSVTSIRSDAFNKCTSLTSVTFQGRIDTNNLGSLYYGRFYSAFDGDLRDKYPAGGIGTYTTTAPVDYNSVWTKR